MDRLSGAYGVRVGILMKDGRIGAALSPFSPLEGLHDCQHWGSPSS